MNVVFEDEIDCVRYINYENTTQLILSLGNKETISGDFISRLFSVALRRLKHFSFKALHMSYPYFTPRDPITTITSVLVHYKYKRTERYYNMLCSAKEIVLFLLEYDMILSTDVRAARELAMLENYKDMSDIFKIILH
jgi:hypothetical protein